MLCCDLVFKLGVEIDSSFQRMEVQVIGNSGFVWSPEDALTLRKNHRIVGCFVGFTPKTFEADLPLVLLPEEVQLLKEKNLIKIIRLNDTEAPSENLIKRFDIFIQRN